MMVVSAAHLLTRKIDKKSKRQADKRRQADNKTLVWSHAEPSENVSENVWRQAVRENDRISNRTNLVNGQVNGIESGRIFR